MSDVVKTINGLDEYLPEGLPPYPRYEPLDQVFNLPAPLKKNHPSSTFSEGFEEWLDGASGIAVILIFGPFLLCLAVLALPILIPYSVVYLVKKVRTK